MQRMYNPTMETLFSCLRMFNTFFNCRCHLSACPEGHGYPAGPVSHLQAVCGCFAFKMVLNGSA